MALSALFLVPKDRGYLYSHHANLIKQGYYGGNEQLKLSLAANFVLPPGFLYRKLRRADDGTLSLEPYYRFPMTGFAVMKLVMVPFADDASAQIVAARVLMLLFWCGAALLAYAALARLTENPPLALAATLFAFSSRYLLDYADAATGEVAMGLFGVMLAFHGMVVFAQTRRFGQLAAKTCMALLFDWHVYALVGLFVMIGLAAGAAAWRRMSEARAVDRASARGGGGETPSRWARRARVLASDLRRSRHVMLGVVAVLFGGAQLSGNLVWEHATLGGETPVAEMPSVRSAVYKLGFADVRGGALFGEEVAFDWLEFFKWQFHSLGIASLPYLALSGIDDLHVRILAHEVKWRERPEWGTLAGVGVAVAVLVAMALCCAGSSFRVLAPLALCGLFWAVALANQTVSGRHEFERVFYFGVPLALGVLLPRLARRVWLALRPRSPRASQWTRASRFGAWAPAVAVASCLGFFVAGHARLVANLHEPEYAQWRKAQMAEFDVVRELARGRDIVVPNYPHALFWNVNIDSFTYHYLLSGVVLRSAGLDRLADLQVSGRPPDFVLAFDRVATPSLLTPDHEAVFLYDSVDAIDAIVAKYDGEYRRFAASPALARSAWSIHRGEGALVYLKSPCANEDIGGRFFAHAQRRRSADGFKPLYVKFSPHGVPMDGRCMLKVPLPNYPVGRVRTGYFGMNEDFSRWRVAFRLDSDVLRAARAAAFGRPPVAVSRHAADPVAGFQVRRHGNALVYLREPCDLADMAARFFLHVTAEPVQGSPPPGFVNLDFEFGEHGAVVDGACVAAAPLPDYGVASVRTGQFANGAEIWSARLEWADAAPGGAAVAVPP